MPRSTPTVRRNGPYAPLSAHYSRDDAILALDAAEDDLAELLFLRSLAYCAGDPRLDGFISDAALRAGVVLRRRRQERVVKAAATLADVGVFVREDKGYRLRTWSKWNRTNSEIERKREADRNRKGNLPPDDEPTDDPGRDEPPDDSPPNPNGIHVESEQIPDGNPLESNGNRGESLHVGARTLQRNPEHPKAVALQSNTKVPPTPQATTGGREPPEPADLDNGDLSELHQKTIAALAGQLRTFRPQWDIPAYTAQLTRLSKQHNPKPWPRIVIAIIAIAADPETKVPWRIMTDGYWWNDQDKRTQAALTRWVAAGHQNPMQALVR